ncbi:MAG: hypothetical protein U5O16_30560 [Rhodococcus sp. (in: high G+C Gram-positive bacteria)]|uniref:hypothetical protein n=1 Tax=Rhodococcus sp. TaxID=1831 RepID=UPI002ADBCCBB|nr:hypothetical protein [Rhodococcus sp. (in: high G+C Gram-positive bacteria)]
MGDSGQISMIGCRSWSCVFNGAVCAVSILNIIVPILKVARIAKILAQIAKRRADLAWQIDEIIEKIERNPSPYSIWNILKGQPDILSLIQELLGIGGVIKTCGPFLDEAFGDDGGNGDGGGAGNGAGNGNGDGAGGQGGGGGGEAAPTTAPQQTQQAQQTQTPQQTYTPPPQTQEPEPTAQTPPPTVESTPPPTAKPHSCEPWPTCAL